MHAVHSYVLFYLAAQCFLKIITRASILALLSIDTVYQLDRARCQHGAIQAARKIKPGDYTSVSQNMSRRIFHDLHSILVFHQCVVGPAASWCQATCIAVDAASPPTPTTLSDLEYIDLAGQYRDTYIYMATHLHQIIPAKEDPSSSSRSAT